MVSDTFLDLTLSI